MVRQKSPSGRGWRNAVLLFLGICMACIIVAVILLSVLPSDMKWFGLAVPTAIATLGTIAGVAGCLCFIRWFTLRVQSGDDDR